MGNESINYWKHVKQKPNMTLIEHKQVSRVCKSLSCYVNGDLIVVMFYLLHVTNGSVALLDSRLHETKPTAVLASFPSPTQPSITCSTQLGRASARVPLQFFIQGFV